jgi:hypothetical protein
MQIGRSAIPEFPESDERLGAALRRAFEESDRSANDQVKRFMALVAAVASRINEPAILYRADGAFAHPILAAELEKPENADLAWIARSMARPAG